MNENLKALIEHLERFTHGKDVSTGWAKGAESLLDKLDDLDDNLDELQHYLLLYRPEGGAHLFNRDQMDQFCRRIIPILKKSNL